MHTFPNFYSFTRLFGLVSKLRLYIHRRGKKLLLLDRIVKMTGLVSYSPELQTVLTCM